MINLKQSDVRGLAERLRRARERAGLSQGQAAKLLSMHRPTLSNIEAGDRKVSAGELTLFAKIYKVSTDWLLGESTVIDSQVKLAARKLRGLPPEDIDTVMQVIDSLRRRK